MSLRGSKGAQKGSNPNTKFDAVFPGASQKVSFTGTSAQCTNPFAANVSILRVFADQDCYLAFGVNPTADSTGLFLPAGMIEYFGINPGDKVAAIQKSSAGTLYIMEGAAS